MQAMNTRPADLQANRDGRISERQRESFGQPQFKPIVHVVIWGHALFIGGLLGAIAIVSGSTAMWLVLGLVTALGAFPFIVMQNEGSYRPVLKNDLAAGTVAQVTGLVILQKREGRRPKHEVIIAGHRFSVSDKAFAAFENHESYRVYYLPRSAVLLSAEYTE